MCLIIITYRSMGHLAVVTSLKTMPHSQQLLIIYTFSGRDGVPRNYQLSINPWGLGQPHEPLLPSVRES